MVGWVDLFPESLRSRNFAMLYFVFGLSRYRFALPRQVVFGLWSLVIGYWFWLLVLGFEFRVLGFGSPCPPVAPSPCPQVSLSPLLPFTPSPRLPFTPSPRLPVSLVFSLWYLVFGLWSFSLSLRSPETSGLWSLRRQVSPSPYRSIAPSPHRLVSPSPRFFGLWSLVFGL
jgi:hypothetical protein